MRSRTSKLFALALHVVASVDHVAGSEFGRDCGVAVDYAKTVKYYNLMFPSGFTLDEYRDYWQRLRFPPLR